MNEALAEPSAVKIIFDPDAPFSRNNQFTRESTRMNANEKNGCGWIFQKLPNRELLLLSACAS